MSCKSSYRFKVIDTIHIFGIVHGRDRRGMSRGGEQHDGIKSK